MYWDKLQGYKQKLWRSACKYLIGQHVSPTYFHSKWKVQLWRNFWGINFCCHFLIFVIRKQVLNLKRVKNFMGNHKTSRSLEIILAGITYKWTKFFSSNYTKINTWKAACSLSLFCRENVNKHRKLCLKPIPYVVWSFTSYLLCVSSQLFPFTCTRLLKPSLYCSVTKYQYRARKYFALESLWFCYELWVIERSYTIQ